MLGIYKEHGHISCGVKIDANKLKDAYDKLHYTLVHISVDEYHSMKLDVMLEEWATLRM